MIQRYCIKEVEEIWSENNKLLTWLEVEKVVVKAWQQLGVVPKSDLDKIYKLNQININRMLEIEKETKHDVVAFTRMISEYLGEEKKWIHLGLTSTDVVDTAQNILIKKSNDLVFSSIINLLEKIKNKAIENKYTLIMGRSHGMYGEPTSLGLKFLLWFEELKRQLERLDLARKQIEVAKISGSMGNYANIEPEIEHIVAKEFELGLDNLSTQVTQRDRHANLIQVFANISTTLEKITTEIRLFQRSEVQEICEGFEKGQKGSSSMPHKKNPISSENVTGLARYIRGFVSTALENNVLWHERDISHSSNERLMLPDIYNILVYILKRTANTIENLVINKNIMLEHINSQNNIFYSQRVLTYILIKYNFSREEVYDFVQKCTLECQLSKKDFKSVLLDNGVTKYITNIDEFNNLFNLNYFLRHVDRVFERVVK
ncbi:adenylosuccinate lyase [Spiroplasma turonicum]|uniref:Adenylosuccinate lyase n=1 Tax=Spiroplasma turonicum TaxID=216946 RepID=A0A0K1P8T8_9MOLU|nr:adenylosuccinate lyase [Spiroplasma turonicum]AKU80312.1 adenylosuccinate lyase [Spiroplasma turonicum]ALX71313.1 adenylosuccinate lyase [Spiroplasma turonicum]